MSYLNHTSTEHISANYGSYKSYLIGFVLSTILTIIPFTMVMQGSASKITLTAVLLICAVAQIIVHLIYFLHLKISSEHKWNLIAFLFTMMIIAILVVGSLWIMWHLNHNLMNH